MAFKAKSFLKESIIELKKVNWPTRKETVRLTVVVVAMSLLMAAILGFFDFGFGYIIERFII